MSTTNKTTTTLQQAENMAKAALSHTHPQNVNVDLQDITQEAWLSLTTTNNDIQASYKQVNAYIAKNRYNHGQYTIVNNEDITDVLDPHNDYNIIDEQDSVQCILKQLKDILTINEYNVLLDCYHGLSITESAIKRQVNKSTISKQLQSARRKAQQIISI